MLSNIMSAIKERTNRSRDLPQVQEEECGQDESSEQTATHEDMQLYESDAGLEIEDDSACDITQTPEPASHTSSDSSSEDGSRTWQMVQCGLSLLLHTTRYQSHTANNPLPTHY